MKLVLDTDPGVDDAIAISMALAANEPFGAELLGITTVGGNVSLRRATRNALALLENAGASGIPVAQGCARPLRGRFRPSVAFHGASGLSIRIPDAKSPPVDDHAADFLSRQLTEHPGEVTVVALGPLTNLAVLLQQHPESLALARRIVVMGGAVNTPGNVTPRAEFNFHSDPVAASAVLCSGLPITLVDLAACRQIFIDREEALALRSSLPQGRTASRVLQNWFRHDPDRRTFEFYDPLAVALALQPELATVRSVRLIIGTSNVDEWGETKAAAGRGTVSLADRVDSNRFFQLLRQLFGWAPE